MSESLHIVCPHFQTTNRVLADQLASAPDCGQCKQPLFTGNPVDLAGAAFDNHLQCNQIRSIPTLALFVNGREVARQLGPMSGSDIVRWTLENIPG